MGYTFVDIEETAYLRALECVTMGETREDTYRHLRLNFPPLSDDATEGILRDAYRDARRTGVKLEDIDASWKPREAPPFRAYGPGI